MSNRFWMPLLATPALLSTTIALTAIVSPAQANEADAIAQMSEYSTEDQVEATLDQVTSVSQLSDVKPTDWAFQALQSLVERYGCIAGYPDKTYRGNRAMTRYEFAAGLNACMDRVNELIAAGTADLAKKEDLETLKKLQDEFAAELATLRGRVDALEARTATLEKQQFSTTTKLKGEAIFSLSGALGDEKANQDVDVDESTTFSNRVRLGLATSFTGKDTLFTRLQAKTIPNFSGATGTNMARLSHEGSGAADNNVRVDKLYYRFNLNDKTAVTVDAVGGEFYANIPNMNPLLASDSQGSISRFGRFSPIYRVGGSAGATVNVGVTDAVTVSLGYLADEANDPGTSRGLFRGSYGAIGQIAFKPIKDLQIGLTYARSFDRRGNVSVTSATGSAFANAPFGSQVATTSDQFGIEGSFKVSPQLVIGGWGSYSKARAQNGTDDDAKIWNWAVTLAAPDLGKKGNLLGLVFGMPPKVTDNDNGLREDEDTSYHLEALYRYQVTDNISVTPGLIVIFNPEHSKDNDNVYVGTIRTTFTF